MYIILIRLDATCVDDPESAAEMARHMLQAMERPEGAQTTDYGMITIDSCPIMVC